MPSEVTINRRSIRCESRIKGHLGVRCVRCLRVLGKAESADAMDRKIELLLRGLSRHESQASFSIKTNESFRDESRVITSKKESLPVLEIYLKCLRSFVRLLNFIYPRETHFFSPRHEIIGRERERSLSISIRARIMNDE